MSVTTILIGAILLFLSLVSFIPQYHHILWRRDCSGISLSYVLFNLIAATEQCALGLHYIVDNVEVSDTIVGSTPTVGDWLNLWQLGVVWICHSALFILCLCYPPERPGPKRTVLAVYISFLLISLAPVVFESFLPAPGDSSEHDRRWFSATFSGVHTMFINPIVTVIGFASLFEQARETRSRPSLGALSIMGLAIQAVVFAVVALYWPLRMTIPQSSGICHHCGVASPGISWLVGQPSITLCLRLSKQCSCGLRGVREVKFKE
ncbi:hypothetical protein EPUS_03090 [Endocarpon pusillum Z07020]|uniref:Uncharacterized protein n=1 Tax=Endocarpon pusillum (strain Z07020 / HMAS-L-300199) TaxID=1263415 RepID=U1GLZ5_ENDPU|nr:uncharacterized protein EPUS_03090 [Endocarpon pusillum Z07020]ERF73258.1 hypothetical protein EPUS_03090 [Endocarpon pusillum Z07020]